MIESMQPPHGPSQSEFVRSFDLVRGVVHEPGKRFTAYAAGDRVDRSQVPPNYVIIEVEGESEKAYAPPYETATFHRWETNNPTDTLDFASYRELSLTHGWGRTPLLVGDSYHARHWLASEWSRYVRSEGDMAHLLKYVFDQNVRGSFTPGQGLHFGHLTQGVIVQSLQYVRRPNASAMPNAIQESLAAAIPERREEITAKIYPSLGKTLLRASFQSPNARTVAKTMPAENIVRGIELYDQAGLVGDKFWTSFGVDAVATVVTPEFAPLLASKLTGPDGERMIREYVPYPERAARAYITRVLETYAKDPNRFQRNAANMLSAMLPGKKTPGVTIGLQALMRETNRMAAAHNRRIDERGGDPARKLSILSEDLTFASDAFLRILALTRRRDIPQQTQVAQWEQDVNHAEVVGAVLNLGSAVEISDADAALQFPSLDEKQRQLVRRMMRGSAGELLQALQKQQAQTAENPKRNNPGKESPA